MRSIPAEGLEVTEMNQDESIELLLTLSEYSEVDETATVEAKRIVQELGWLPLAITQAAALIRTSGIYTFLSIFHSSGREFITDEPEENRQYARSIAMTRSVSLQRLSSDSMALIELLPFLNPDEIPVEFLEFCHSAVGENLKRILEDKYAFNKALSGLQSLSLINIREHGKKVSIHRLVQFVVRDQITPTYKVTLQKDIITQYGHVCLPFVFS